jgi:hypothetical protein
MRPEITRTINGTAMKISFFGNIIMPMWGCPWMAYYKRKLHPDSVPEGKPIPDNVIYLDAIRKLSDG